MPLGFLPGTPTGQVVAQGKSGQFVGYNFRETTGSSAAVVHVYSGVAAVTGNLLATVGIPEGTSVDVWYPPQSGEGFTNGVFVETVSGTTPEGFVRYNQAVGG